MSQQGPYQIWSPAGEIHHVAFEVWLLDQFWNNPTLVDHTYSDFRTMLINQGLIIPPDFEDLIQLKIIALKPGTGVTVVTPMKERSIQTSKYLNDIWTNNKTITWVMSSDLKFFILALRKKSFAGLQAIIGKYGPSRSRAGSTAIDQPTEEELDTMDVYDCDAWKYLTDTTFHEKLRSCSCHLNHELTRTHGVSYPDGKGQFGYLNSSNELILVIPEIPHPNRDSDFDGYLRALTELADTQIDVLTTATGNVSMIWSKEISNDVKTIRREMAVNWTHEMAAS